MCELFAMSSSVPIAICCSLEELDRHSEGPSGHADGWGLARYVDRDVLLLKEAGPAAASPLARWVRETPLSSRLVVSHLRKATQGRVEFMNCQPFTRESGGAAHVFAHNGHLDASALRALLPPSGPRPIGDTDSELAFCALLGHLGSAWRSEHPTLAKRAEIVSAFARSLREMGPANFLYADGEALYAHGHRRMQATGSIGPPGLWMLELPEGVGRACERVLSVAGPAIAVLESRAVLFASIPLSADVRWRQLEEGEVVVVRDGTVVDAPWACTIADPIWRSS